MYFLYIHKHVCFILTQTCLFYNYTNMSVLYIHKHVYFIHTQTCLFYTYTNMSVLYLHKHVCFIHTQTCLFYTYTNMSVLVCLQTIGDRFGYLSALQLYGFSNDTIWTSRYVMTIMSTVIDDFSFYFFAFVVVHIFI